MCKVKVNNKPEDTEKYIVARLSDGELWYWGSWDDKVTATRVASTFKNGVVVERNC